MHNSINRRRFLGTTAAASVSTLAIGAAAASPPGSKRPIIVASGNGLRSVEKAMELVKQGHDPLDAAIEGVAIVEADPTDHSVGLGGLPNEDGVVELDAAVMHGPTHGGGSVASIRNIIHPAAVARLVMKRTRHCLLVGDGALRFARAHGFPEVNLLTDEARQIWLHWKETHDPSDDWLPPAKDQVASFIQPYMEKRVTGTIHCSVLDTHGNLGCTTTTSGLSWKIPGRVGDSPILGAGLYLDNEVGSAGSTGVGEANLLNLSSYLVVEGMRRGLGPKDAVMDACKRIATTSVRDPKRRRPDGRTTFNVSFYAVSKDGKFFGGCIYPGGKMAVHDGDTARVVCTRAAPRKVISLEHHARARASEEVSEYRKAQGGKRRAHHDGGGTVRIDQTVRAGRDQGATHRSVGAKNPRRLAVDGQLPAGIIDVGKDDQTRRVESRSHLDAIRGVAIDRDGLGRIASRTRERSRHVRAKSGVDLDPGDVAWVMNLAPVNLPELVILVEHLIHQSLSSRSVVARDRCREAGTVNDPGARKGGLVAKNLDVVVT